MEHTAALVADTAYFPPIAFFSAIHGAKTVYIEGWENFQKQSYRNRCYILTANGTTRLTVPLVKSNSKLPISRVRIDYSSRWELQHWRTIVSAYANAPFFEHYAGGVEKTIMGRHEHLESLNHQTLTLCLEYLGLDVKVSKTDSYIKAYQAPFTDLRGVFHPKKENGIVPAKSYQQVFGQGFVPGLSILDLLFCEGPAAARLLTSPGGPTQIPRC